jgi:hypothetical protein
LHTWWQNFNATSLEEKEDEPDLDLIDEEIIKEHILIDPTKLNEKFSHLDCEINVSLDANCRKKLNKIIDDNKETFATSKLDVGQYKKFLVNWKLMNQFQQKKRDLCRKKKLIFAIKLSRNPKNSVLWKSATLLKQSQTFC